MSKSGLAHCYHHDIHWEYCFDYDERVEYIKSHKPVEEQPLRLKLFGLVPSNKVPGRSSKEWLAYVKASKVYEQSAWMAWMSQETRGAYLEKYANKLVKLHTELYPDCPFNGQTIFTLRTGEESGIKEVGGLK